MDIFKQCLAVVFAFGTMYGLVTSVPLLFSWHHSKLGVVAALGGIACGFICLALLQ